MKLAPQMKNLRFILLHLDHWQKNTSHNTHFLSFLGPPYKWVDTVHIYFLLSFAITLPFFSGGLQPGCYFYDGVCSKNLVIDSMAFLLCVSLLSSLFLYSSLSLFLSLSVLLSLLLVSFSFQTGSAFSIR